MSDYTDHEERLRGYRMEAWEDERRDEMERDARDAQDACRAVQVENVELELADKTGPAYMESDMNLCGWLNEFTNVSVILAHLVGNTNIEADPFQAQALAKKALREAAEHEVDAA